MDLGAMVNQLTWKKMAVVAFVVLLGIWILREIVFLTFFHETKHMFNQFNSQFEQQQKKIHNKLMDSENDLDKRTQAFDESVKRTHQMMEESSKHFQEIMTELDRQALEREKKFNEDFAKLPQQMLEQNKMMSEKMLNEFKQESKRQSNNFKNKVIHDN